MGLPQYLGAHYAKRDAINSRRHAMAMWRERQERLRRCEGCGAPNMGYPACAYCGRLHSQEDAPSSDAQRLE